MYMEQEKLNAEVVAVFPDKVKISVDDLENFQLAEEKLKVGSYLRIADNDNAVLIAIIENFNIEVGALNDERQRENIFWKRIHWALLKMVNLKEVVTLLPYHPKRLSQLEKTKYKKYLRNH